MATNDLMLTLFRYVSLQFFFVARLQPFSPLVLGTEPKGSCMLDNCSALNLHSPVYRLELVNLVGM